MPVTIPPGCESCRTLARQLETVRHQLDLAEADARFWEKECRDRDDEIARLDALIDDPDRDEDDDALSFG